MKTLSQAAFERAQEYLHTQARDLEARLFDFHFLDVADGKTAVIQALQNFQNADSGFGQALEPDVRLPHSSVVATKYALQILIDIQASAEEKLVQDCINYLLQAYDPEKCIWRLVSRQVTGWPHAPWWAFETLEKEFGSFLVNPKAGILRCFYTYPELVPPHILNQATLSLLSDIQERSDQLAFFDAISLLQLLQAPPLDAKIEQGIYEKLAAAVENLVNPDPQAWAQFAIKPLWLAPAPYAPLAGILAASIQTNLDYEIEHQNADGSWPPTWSWGETDPENWGLAEREWRGILTLAVLRSLSSFGRIEHLPADSSDEHFKYHLD